MCVYYGCDVIQAAAVDLENICTDLLIKQFHWYYSVLSLEARSNQINSILERVMAQSSLISYQLMQS